MHVIEKLSLALFGAVFLLLSCNREEAAQPLQADAGNAEVMTKVVRMTEEVDMSSFLFKFAQKPTEKQIQALYMDGVESVQPLFPSMPGKEEMEARFGMDRWYEVKMQDGAPNLHQTVQKVAALADVAVVEYNAVVPLNVDEGVPYSGATKATVSSSFNDPMLLDQWHYNNQGNASITPNVYKGADINVKDVWAQLTCGDPDIIVAVVDEGVQYNHPDLKDNMWMNTKEIPGNGIDDDGNGYVDDVYGYNFMDNTGTISWTKERDSGHGTHCAGTISAVNNNGKGVAGIAGGSGSGDGCRLMSCQIFSDRSSTTNGTAKAIKYAADNGASVISCSYGWSSPFASDNYFYNNVAGVEIDAIHYFEAMKGNNPVLDGNIAVFASGNESMNHANYPGAYVDIISVSSFGPDFLPAYYTNYGPGCNIAAPGGNQKLGTTAGVLSTVPKELYQSDYAFFQGTSMACPHVSGVVALALSYAKKQGKKFTVQQFKQLIMASTKDIDKRIAGASTDYAKYYHLVGTGAIDAWSLMMHIDGIPSATATIGKNQWIDLTDLFGSASVSLTYLDVEVPQATIDALGLQKIKGTPQSKYPVVPEGECYAYVQYGRLYIHPTKIGGGKISISMVGGGDHLGGGDNPPGGMLVTEEISIIAREVEGGNGTGGWL